MKSCGLLKSNALIYLILALIMLFSLASCTQPPAPSSVPSTQSIAPTTASATAAAVKPIHWRFQSITPVADATWHGFEVMRDVINQASEGRVEVELFPDGGLVNLDQLLDAMKGGIADGGLVGGIFWTPRIILGELMVGLPMGWTNWDEYWKIYSERGLKDLIIESWAKEDIHYLAPYPNSPYCLCTTFPVNKLEDLKGKKIRTWGVYADFINAAGGAVTSLPPGEIYMGMKLGTIDGFIYSLPELEINSLKEVIKYVIYPPVANPSTLEFVVSMQSWNALPKDIQQKIEKAIDQNIVPRSSLYDPYMKEVDKAVTAAKQYGVQFTTLSDAEVARWRDVAVTAAWSKIASRGPLAAKAIQIMKDTLLSPTQTGK